MPALASADALDSPLTTYEEHLRACARSGSFRGLDDLRQVLEVATSEWMDSLVTPTDSDYRPLVELALAYAKDAAAFKPVQLDDLAEVRYAGRVTGEQLLAASSLRFPERAASGVYEQLPGWLEPTDGRPAILAWIAGFSAATKGNRA